MKKRLKTVTAATMALAMTLGGGLWASSARAAEATSHTSAEQSQTDQTYGQNQGRTQWSGKAGHKPGARLAFQSEELATLLGLTSDELSEAVKSGKTLAAIAQEQGVDVQSVVDLIVKAQTEQLDKQLAAGKLTQDQYDARKAELSDFATKLVNGEAGGKFGFPGDKGGRGKSGFPGKRGSAGTNESQDQAAAAAETEAS